MRSTNHCAHSSRLVLHARDAHVHSHAAQSHLDSLLLHVCYCKGKSGWHAGEAVNITTLYTCVRVICPVCYMWHEFELAPVWLARTTVTCRLHKSCGHCWTCIVHMAGGAHVQQLPWFTQIGQIACNVLTQQQNLKPPDQPGI